MIDCNHRQIPGQSFKFHSHRIEQLCDNTDVIVNTFYSPSCFSQKIAKGPVALLGKD